MKSQMIDFNLLALQDANAPQTQKPYLHSEMNKLTEEIKEGLLNNKAK